jgi:DNA-binding PadR family transcriptional regulator
MTDARELLKHFSGGFIRLHILYHAAREDVCGVEMMRELRRHGYRLGPGTLYPILHDLQRSGILVSHESNVSGKRRRNYRITKKGARILSAAREQLKELFSEVIQDRDKMHEARAKPS